MIEIGMHHRIERIVEPAYTAASLKSGLLEVLATRPPVEPIRPDEEFTYQPGDNLNFEIYKDDIAQDPTSYLTLEEK